ncbi:MAG: glycosyltransferase family 2 protein [Leptospiraceae bacterium]|nr:glycosyltransferase family 2 protein [Leptospiraceae bacterium]
MITKKEISIVIPVYKSKNILYKLYNEIDSALKNYIYEVILVNDNSPDDSWNEILKLCENNSHIIGVNLRKNFGQDAAIMAGLNQTSGKYIVIMDDDLQHSPFDIEKLYLECKKGYDVCYANFKKKKQSWWKNMGSWFNGKVAEYILDKPPDMETLTYQMQIDFQTR